MAALTEYMDKNFAYIRIDGTEDVSEITHILKIEPTRSWNVGDKRKNGSVYDFSHWSYERPEFEKEILDEALSEVISFIENKKSLFAKLPSHFSPTIQCVGYHEKQSPGFHLSKELITKLGNLGWAVDFDLYCNAE